MKYLDIAVRISPKTEQGHGVVVTSPQGGGSSTLRLPFALSELSGVVFGVTQTLREVTPTAAAAGAPGGPTAREFGEKLFEALFQGDARSALDKTIAVAQDRQDTGVRIRLEMDLTGDGMAEVASLPWELMRPRNRPALFTSTQTLLVRSPDVLEPADPKPFEPPLRILAMVSRPRGAEALNLDEERDRIKKIWGPVPGVTVEFVAPVVDELLKRLREGDYHVVHYMGHGDFETSTGRGALLLEDEHGNPRLVSGEDLGVYLKDELRTLRLVFLNACKTGTTSARSGLDPFAGIATSLIQSGVPAVVGMQFPISDEAAIRFCETFYQSVAQGLPVDAAVAEGRKVLWGGEQSEWATPVLFLRSSDGFLFKTLAGVTTSVPAAQAAAAIHDRGRVATAPADDPWGSGDGHRVFLAATDQDMGHVCRQLSSALRKEGIRVIDSVPPPYEAPEHAATVRGLAAAADLCVHVLGDGPGAEVDGVSAEGAAALLTYPLEQLRIGLEAARSQLVLIPEQIDIQRLEDMRYADRVRELVRMPRDPGRFQLVSIGTHQMKDAVVARLGELAAASRSAAKASGGGVRAAFVDLHYADLQYATDLITYLGQRNIAPIMMPSSDTSPADALSMFEANLTKVPLYLVVFGSVTRDWVTNRLSEAFQSVLRNPGANTRIGVYLAPPVKGSDQLRFPPFCDVAINMAGFDAGSVDALIARAAE